MRFSGNESPHLVLTFPTGATVNVDAYNLTTNAKVVDNQAMSEVAGTGTFKFLHNPAVSAFTEFLYIASDGTNTRKVTKSFSGYVDLLALEATAQVIKTEADKVQLIPVNPLLVTDTRLDAIKSVTDLITFTGGNVNSVAQVVADKSGYALSTPDKNALAVIIEAVLLNEGDGQQLMDAITTAINNSFDLPAAEVSVIAAGVRTELAPELAFIDAAVSTAGGGLDEAGLHSALNSYANKADYRATALNVPSADMDEIAERTVSKII